MKVAIRQESPLLRSVSFGIGPSIWPLPAADEVSADMSAVLQSLNLQKVRRFFNQIHWTGESIEADFADRAEPGLKLENVAAHSWHVAETVLLLGSHFKGLDTANAISMALLHDKLELFTGDFDPVGPDGKGTFSHSFNKEAQDQKNEIELRATEHYISQLRPSIQNQQRKLLLDYILGETNESRFVRGVDKLQALAFVHVKKDGFFSDEHLLFSIRYSRKAIEQFSGLYGHYVFLLDLLLNRVAEKRKCNRLDLDSQLFNQLELQFPVTQ